MAEEPAIVDPIQAGCAAGRRARADDMAAGVAPPAHAVLLMLGAIECAALIGRLPGPPQHDPAIARERFVWAFVLGYTEGTGNREQGTRAGRPVVRRRVRRAAAPRIAAVAKRGVRIPSTRRRIRRRPLLFPVPYSPFPRPSFPH
jgi:hypothetical protein